jgi:hypothetical protein
MAGVNALLKRAMPVTINGGRLFGLLPQRAPCFVCLTGDVFRKTKKGNQSGSPFFLKKIF